MIRPFSFLCLFFPLLALAQDPADSVVIHEIHYHPDLDTEFVEFIELYNPTEERIDLAGWAFSDGIDHVFPAESVLEPGAYYVLVQDVAAYNRKFGSIFAGGVKANAAWDAGSLSNDGETLTLRDAANVIVDKVDYQTTFPWPVMADGGGASMELVHPTADNNLSGHWRASASPTPGKVNGTFLENPPPAVRQVEHTPQQPTANDVVIVQAKATDAHGVASVSLEVQVVEPGTYIRLTDEVYETAWQTILMNDAGTEGDAVAGDATYSATVPAAMIAHRHLVRYRIRAEDAAGQTVTLPYPDDPTPNRTFFVYDGVPPWSGSANGQAPRRTFTTEELTLLPVYHLLADGDDVERCQYRSSDENRLFRGTMVYDGRVYDHIEFKIRGEFSTYQSGKNKWKFFFNRGEDFEARDNYGIKYPSPFRVMNFSACASPWVPANRGMSGLDESTAFRLHALAGVPSPKTHHVHFRIVDEAEEAPSGNQYGGDLWGLYLSQEHPDGRFLNRVGLPDGNTYKIEGGNGDQKHQGPFESDYGDFVTQARRTQPAEWWEANMNMKAYYGFRAMNRAVGNIDIREGWNHYFYQHPNGQWYPIPWDLDMTFMPETHWSGTIDAKACLNTPEIAVAYASRCRELLDLLLSDRAAGGGQVGSIVEETAQWLGSQRAWTDVASIGKLGGTTAAVSTAVPHGYDTGDQITIIGVATSGYNGTHEIMVTGETTFTYVVSLFSPGNVDGEGMQAGKVVGMGSAWSEIDMAMWNNHPRTTGGHKDNFYANPTNQGFQGGTLTRTLSSPDFSGFVDYVKDFTTDTDPDDFKVGDGDQRGYGYNYVKLESDDGKAPDRPQITYSGADGFPVDGLTFTSSEFSGGTLFQQQTFTGMEWRLGEIYNPSTPNYEAGDPWHYEISPVWESGRINEFTPEITIPGNVLRPGNTYRARVKHLNQLGGWSHWSEPIEFVAAQPDLSAYADLVITELMYHPGAPSESELAAGFRREDFEFIEIHHRGTGSMDLTPLRFTKGVDFDFDSGSITMVAPGQTFLVVANAEAFSMRYGDQLLVAGVYEGNLANGGERLKLSYGAGAPVIEFTYDDEGDWPVESDGDGYPLVRRDLDANADLSAAGSWEVGSVQGNPGSVTVSDPGLIGDSDGDGMSDEAEALAGTDPNDPDDILSVQSVTRAADGVRLTWSSVVDKRYLIDYTNQLHPGAWEVIGEISADGASLEFEDLDAARTQSGEGTIESEWPPERLKTCPVASAVAGWWMKKSWLLVGALLVGLSFEMASGKDWPQFRGPGGQGHAAEGSAVPLRWSPETHLAWKVPIPGKAWSSPIVVEDRIYVTTAVETDNGLSLRALGLALADGKLLWDREIFARPDVGDFHKKNSHASPTPVWEAGRVYVHFGHHGTACVDASDGKVVWKQTSLEYPPLHGNGGSPILFEDKLIFSGDGTKDPFIVALNKSDGRVAWKTDRRVEVSRKFSFSTPLAIEVNGSWQIVSPASGAVIAYDPNDGEEIWRCGYDEGYSVVPRPLYAHGLVYVCSGFNTASLFAIDPTGKGDVTKSHIKWQVDKRIPKESSPIIVGDLLYTNDDKGILSCIDAKSGEELWQKRLDGGGGYSASPVYAGDYLYFHNGDGVTTVVKPDKEYHQVAENQIGEYGLSSFAVTSDGFVIRTELSLLRLK